MEKLVFVCLQIFNIFSYMQGYPIDTSYVDLKYKVNLKEPCGANTLNFSIISTEFKRDLPNMLHITTHVAKELNSIIDDFVEVRFPESHSILQTLSTITYPMPLKLSEEIPDMVKACTEKQDTLALLWQRMLEYIICIGYVKQTELHWSGHDTNMPLRMNTFEKEITAFEKNYVSNLLCSIKTVAEAEHVQLKDSILETKLDEQKKTMAITDSKQHADYAAYLILNSFTQDFVSFSEEFFQCDK